MSDGTFDLDRVRELRSELRRLNRMDLTAARVVDGGRAVVIPPGVLKDWRFTGLNNTDIVDFWRPGSSVLLDATTEEEA